MKKKAARVGENSYTAGLQRIISPSTKRTPVRLPVAAASAVTSPVYVAMKRVEVPFSGEKCEFFVK